MLTALVQLQALRCYGLGQLVELYHEAQRLEALRIKSFIESANLLKAMADLKQAREKNI